MKEKVGFLLMAFYRTPAGNVNKLNAELEKILLSTNLVMNKRNIIVVGIINICYLNQKHGAQKYLDILHNYKIYEILRVPQELNLEMKT